MSKTIKISEGVARDLDAMKHPGQTYDGVIRELLERDRKREGATK